MPQSERFTLANRKHLGVFTSILMAMGALCPECGGATRVTSAKYAKCQKCGRRVTRQTQLASVQPDDVLAAPAERKGGQDGR